MPKLSSVLLSIYTRMYMYLLVFFGETEPMQYILGYMFYSLILRNRLTDYGGLVSPTYDGRSHQVVRPEELQFFFKDSLLWKHDEQRL